MHMHASNDHTHTHTHTITPSDAVAVGHERGTDIAGEAALVHRDDTTHTDTPIIGGVDLVATPPHQSTPQGKTKTKRRAEDRTSLLVRKTSPNRPPSRARRKRRRRRKERVRVTRS